MLCLLGFFVDNLFLFIFIVLTIVSNNYPDISLMVNFSRYCWDSSFFSEKLKVKRLKLKNRKILKSREKSSIRQSRELKQWKGGIGCQSPHWTSSCTTCHLIRKMALQRFQWNEKQYHDGGEKNWKLLN